MQRAQVPDRMTDPVCQRRPVQIEALAGVNLRLAIQRQMVGIFVDQHMRPVRRVSMPPSMGRSGAGACTTASSQARQPYRGRRITRTRN